MPVSNAITPSKLARLTGTPAAPPLFDLRDQTADARLMPGALPRPGRIADWGPQVRSASAILVCEDGGAASQGAAAWLRALGVEAEILEGGFAAWEAAGLPLVPARLLPPRDALGRTLWVTRARPKVDRIACPWLIRRFVDPAALFLFVPAGEVPAVAEAYDAAPFDLQSDGVFWSHRGERCTFDTMIEELGLSGFEGLAHLAPIVRGADTDRLDLAPEAAGLLALSLGLSRLHASDTDQLEAGMPLYDALYRWCRDARGETHDWVSHTPRQSERA